MAATTAAIARPRDGRMVAKISEVRFIVVSPFDIFCMVTRLLSPAF
jgi:hypothetical protein